MRLDLEDDHPGAVRSKRGVAGWGRDVDGGSAVDRYARIGIGFAAARGQDKRDPCAGDHRAAVDLQIAAFAIDVINAGIQRNDLVRGDMQAVLLYHPGLSVTVGAPLSLCLLPHADVEGTESAA